MNERIKEMLNEVQGIAIAWEISKDALPIWTLEIETQMWGDESIGYYVRAMAVIGHVTLPAVPTLHVWDIMVGKSYHAPSFDDAIVLVREFKQELAMVTSADVIAQPDTMVYINDVVWLKKTWQNWQDVIELTKEKVA
jgi:hypothetical protein